MARAPDGSTSIWATRDPRSVASRGAQRIADSLTAVLGVNSACVTELPVAAMATGGGGLAVQAQLRGHRRRHHAARRLDPERVLRHQPAHDPVELTCIEARGLRRGARSHLAGPIRECRYTNDLAFRGTARDVMVALPKLRCGSLAS